MPGDERISIEITAEVADAISKIEALKAAIDSLDGRDVRVRTTTDSSTGRLVQDVRNLGNEADNTARRMDNLGRTTERDAQSSRRSVRDLTGAFSDFQRGLFAARAAQQQWAVEARMAADDVARQEEAIGNRIGADLQRQLFARRALEQQWAMEAAQSADRVARAEEAAAAREAEAYRRSFEGRVDALRTVLPQVDREWQAASERFRSRFAAADEGMAADFRQRFLNRMETDARKSFDSLVVDAERSSNGIVAAMQKVSKLGDGRGGMWPIAGISAGILAGVPLINGVGTMAVGGAVAAAPAALGSIALYKLLGDAMKDVTTAAQGLETQTVAYNTAANQTVSYLQHNSQAMSNFHTLLGQVTPAEKDMLLTLNQQDVTWQTLTRSQQAALIQIRDTPNLYKALTKSQQDQVNALLAEQKATDGLSQTQQTALTAYLRMHAQWDALWQNDPAVLGTATAAMRLATDVMKAMGPIVHEAALAWTDLFNRADAGVNGSGFKTFMADMAGVARQSIEGFGKALGNIAVGFAHIWEALQPMIGPFLSFLDQATAKFANWATTPKGISDLQNFMATLRRDAPQAFRDLHDLATLVATLWSSFSSPGFLIVFDDVMKALTFLAGGTIGKIVLQFAAWALVVSRLSVAFGPLVTVLQKVRGLFAADAAATSLDTGAEVANTGAADADAAATARLALAQRSLPGGLTMAPASVRGAVTAGGVGNVAGLGATAGIAAAAAAIGLAITQYATDIQRKSDAAAGIIRGTDGYFTAAATVSGQQVSGAFRNLADNVGASSAGLGQVVGKNGQLTGQRFVTYASDFNQNNQDIRNMMDLGKTELGQTAGLFVASMHGDVANMAASISKSGKTLDQQLQTTMTQVFTAWGETLPGYWKGLKDVNNKASADAFAQIEAHSKTDYTNLGTAMKQFEDDMKAGRQDNAKQDAATLTKAMQQYMTDSNNGLIDTSNKLNRKLGQDIAQFMQDAAKGDTAAAQKDLQQMGKDVAAQWQSTTADPVTSQAKAAIVHSGREIAGQYGDSVRAMQAQADHAVGIGVLDFQNTLSQAQKNISAEIQKTSPTGTVGGSRFASGGVVHGPGGVDKVPAWLTAGEFVVNANATRQHLPLLTHLNARGYADGGVVGNFGQGAFDYGLMGDVDYRLAMKAFASQVNSAMAAIKAAMAAANGPLPHGSGSAAAAQAYAASLLASFGWGPDQMPPLIRLWNQESGWNAYAVNPSSGAYGIPQSLGHGHPYNLGDMKAQVMWGLRYIKSTYGSPGAAWAHEMANNWYDNGGWLAPGMSQVTNGTGRPEAVLTGTQWKVISSLAGTAVAMAAQGGGCDHDIYIDGEKVFRVTRKHGYDAQMRNSRNTYTSKLRHA